jgi:hypothetical protein
MLRIGTPSSKRNVDDDDHHDWAGSGDECISGIDIDENGATVLLKRLHRKQSCRFSRSFGHA